MLFQLRKYFIYLGEQNKKYSERSSGLAKKKCLRFEVLSPGRYQ